MNPTACRAFSRRARKKKPTPNRLTDNRNGMNPSARNIALPLAAALALFPFLFLSSACSSGVSRKELQQQEGAVQSGDEAAIDRIYSKRGAVRPEDRSQYVETVSRAPAEQSSVLLRSLFADPAYAAQKGDILRILAGRPDETNADFIRSRLNQEPALYTPELESFLLRRADRASAETVLNAVLAGRATLNPRTMEFLGSNALPQALPPLQSAALQPQNAEPAMAAIARLGTPGASSYLIETAGSPEHPARIAAIRHLSGASEQARARSLLHSILKEDRDAKAITAAQEALRDMGYNEESYTALKEVYEKSEDAAIRNSAVETMATLRQVETVEVRKELKEPVPAKPEDAKKPPLEADAKKDVPVLPRGGDKRGLVRSYNDTGRLTEIIKNRPVREPHPERDSHRGEPRRHRQYELPVDNAPVAPAQRGPTRPQRLFPLDNSNAASSAYDRSLLTQLQAVLGDDAHGVRLRMHNALLSYADSDSGNARFIQRAYRKGFGVDEAKAKELMKTGLHLPRSMPVLLQAIQAEYARPDMQVYALSTFFAIKRKHAGLLLAAHRRGAL